ncbi:MAG TPA: bifunctional UDP-N-acetylglucosamine diphosphorylase/glucosamine-1-phosphate N-acetyltransferase GlmU [Bryobacteraceae bacterium]
MSSELNVVILAAGLGTRMRSNKAKVLHEAGGDTLLNQIIRVVLQVAPAERIVAVVGHQADQVRRSVRVPGIRFAEQLEQKGTGHAVLCARSVLDNADGKLLILNGDGPLLRAETLRALLNYCHPQATGGAIVTTRLNDPTGYGRIVRDEQGLVEAIVEQKAARGEQLAITEINPGLYCFDARLFWQYAGEITPDNPAKEYYLTDMVAILTRHGYKVAPLLVPDETELLGINTRVELAQADKILRSRKAQELMLAGVTIENPDSVAIDMDVEIGADSVVEANVQLRGRTRIAAGCHIGSGSYLRDCVVEENARVLPYVVAENSSIGAGSFVGPFSRLRLDAEIAGGAHVGNFVELKKTRLGEGSKANHLAYLGDSTIGAGSNIGAGTITCNYDGQKKHPTKIGERVFVGSNSTLVAPISIGEGAYIAAGSVITKDVEQDALAVGRAYQVDKPGWAKKRRNLVKEPQPSGSA